MTFGPKRGHVLFVFESFVKDFGLLIIALVIAYVKKDAGIFTENIPILVVILCGPIAKVFQYLFTTYAIDDEKLVVKSGWLSKKNLEVPLSTITTVDFSQNIIHQISGTYRLNVDNASNVAAENTKIKMTFGEADARLVKELLTKGKKSLDGFNLESTGEELQKEMGDDYLVKAKTLLMMGAIKSKGVFLLEVLAILGASSTFLQKTFEINDDQIGRVIFDFSDDFGVIGGLLFLLPVLLIFSIICGAIGAFIKYYGFHVLDNGEVLKIEYGLITKKRYTIHKKKISGFFYQQSFFMKILKTGVLQIFAVGYGGTSNQESTEEPILFPLLSESLLRTTLRDILPEMEEETEYEKPKARTLPYFFYSAVFITALVILMLTVGIALTVPSLKDLWVLGILALLLGIGSVIMQYKNTGIYGNQRNISMSWGGFKKTTIFIKTNNVESVTMESSVFKQKKGVTNVKIGYIAPLAESNKMVKNLSISAYDHIQSKLIY